MTTPVALALLAASIPITTLILKLCSQVTPVQFVKLETHFTLFRDEVRRDLKLIRKMLEKDE